MSTYRDDLEAAMARADAAEQETERLRAKLARLEDANTAPAPVSEYVPERFAVAHRGAELQVTWTWWRRHHIVFVVALGGLLGGLAYAMSCMPTRNIDGGDMATWVLLTAGVATVLYVMLALVLNRTTMTVHRRGNFGVQHGPVPVGITRLLASEDIVKLRAAESESGWVLRARTTSGHERSIVGVATEAEAAYLASAIERHLDA